MSRRIKHTSPRPTEPQPFEGHCTACDFEGTVYTNTCPECSRRTVKPGDRQP